MDKISLVHTKFDQVMAEAAQTVAVVMVVASLPQAFILLRLMNQLDLYVFVDLKYPSNFEKVLKLMTNTVVDYIPNLFASLADDEGSQLPLRFQNFGYEVHILKNIGSTLTVAMVLALIWLASLPFKQSHEDKLKATI